MNTILEQNERLSNTQVRKITEQSGMLDFPTAENIDSHWYDDDQLKREYRYLRAEQITRKMLDQGLITLCEFDKIMADMRRKFQPFMADIMA